MINKGCCWANSNAPKVKNPNFIEIQCFELSPARECCITALGMLLIKSMLCYFIQSGAFGLVVGHPADTIKVRQQTSGQIGAWQCAVNTFKNEGVSCFDPKIPILYLSLFVLSKN